MSAVPREERTGSARDRRGPLRVRLARQTPAERRNVLHRFEAESGQFGFLPEMSLAGAQPAEQVACLVVAQSPALVAKRISIFLQPKAIKIPVAHHRTVSLSQTRAIGEPGGLVRDLP